MNNLRDYYEKNGGYELLKQLCAITAPSKFEDKRAQFCCDYLKSVGYANTYIDEAKNVICPVNCDGKNEITVFCAHTDTVFPDTEPMPYVEENGKIMCPGVGDDTASVVALLLSAKYIKENNLFPKDGMLIVCNSCEEGLGNLYGTRTLMKNFEGRIKQFISYDSTLQEIANECVGSHRYNVEVKTPGGHSFGSFGKKNAIAALSEIVNEIYKIEVPVKENSKTTYNVGIISGGTSVNTIAQNANMLCEYRSNNIDCLEIMKNKFEEIFKNARCDDVELNVQLIGERPCGCKVDKQRFDYLVNNSVKVIERVTGEKVKFHMSSTDCNIPMSLGVPGIAIGVYEGAGAHTRGEWLYKNSLPVGFEISVEIMKEFCLGD